MEADRPFRRLFRKGKRLFRRGYGHEHRYRPSSQAGNYRGRPLGRLRSKAEVSLPPPFIIGGPRSTVPVRSQGAEQPTRAVRAASLHPRPAAAGNFVPDPVTLGLTERAEHPMLAPSLHAFRAYASNHPEFSELKARGLLPMMRAHQGLRLAIFGRHRRLGAASRSASGLLVAPSGSRRRRLPLRHRRCRRGPEHGREPWGQGTVPSLYQNDASWADVPYGQATLASTGAAPVALAMAYVAATGDTEYTPVAFAQWATDHDLTAAGTDTVASFLQQAGSAFGLAVEPVEVDAQTLRRAIVSNVPCSSSRSPALSRPPPQWWCWTTSTRTPTSCCTTRRARAARPRAGLSMTSPTPPPSPSRCMRRDLSLGEPTAMG